MRSIPFPGCRRRSSIKVVEKFVFQLEAQLADRGVTIELSEEAAKWLAENGYDEKFGARPLARVIQEHIKKPLADELLFGKLVNGGTVRVLVKGKGEDSKLVFEYIPADPPRKPKAKARRTTTRREGGRGGVRGEADASPRKALAGPEEKKERSSKAHGLGAAGARRRKPD